jgi:hypothetical protein
MTQLLVVPHLLRAGVLEVLLARDVWRAGSERCWRRFGELLDQLEARAPVSGFWLGGAPSVADLGLFAQLDSLRTEMANALSMAA